METDQTIYGRFSFVTVFKPRAFDEKSEPKYSVNILFSKTDPEFAAQVKKAKKIQNYLIEEVKSKNNGKLPKGFKTNGLKDGDAADENGDTLGEAYAGMYYVVAYSTVKPGIIDRRKNAITDESGFYSGCHGRATCNWYIYGGGKGLTIGLNNLQFLEAGEKLGGGRVNAEDDFDDLPDEDDDFDELT